MNPTQPTRATVTSSITLKLRRRFDFKQSVAAPSLLTWFEVIGYTVLLEQDIASLKYRIGRTSYTEVILRDRAFIALCSCGGRVSRHKQTAVSVSGSEERASPGGRRFSGDV